MFFSKFREQREAELKAKMEAIVPQKETFILKDTNLISIKGTPEYVSSLSENSPTNHYIFVYKRKIVILIKVWNLL